MEFLITMVLDMYNVTCRRLVMVNKDFYRQDDIDERIEEIYNESAPDIFGCTPDAVPVELEDCPEVQEEVKCVLERSEQCFYVSMPALKEAVRAGIVRKKIYLELAEEL
jgi:hypothetical protein